MNACRFFGSIVLLAVPAVSLAQTPAAAPQAAPAAKPAPVVKPAPTLPTTHGLVVANMDPSVKPGDNLYLYANGKWQGNTEMPADRPSLSSFSVLGDVVNFRVQSIIAEAAKSGAAAKAPATAAKTDQRRLADLYRSYTDQAALDARGLTAIKPQLAAIGAIMTTTDL